MSGFNSWWVAKDLFVDDDFSRSLSPLSVPDIRINPPVDKKKQVALRLYSVIGQSIVGSGSFEIILLAENENKAKVVAQSECGVDANSCKEIEGPFKNGTILMMKDVNN